MALRETTRAEVQPSSGSAKPQTYPVRVDGTVDPDLGRWQWLGKWFLAIPHLVVLALLWAGALVLTLIAGLSILFTGTYPRAIFDFNVGVLRWTWRVQYFGFNVLATDRYPPFSLEPVPDYPADLSVEYPTSLSRGLVLVKSWLLALPHLLLVVMFAGVPFWVARDLPWSVVAGGLLGVLTLAAMVVLAASGRYPASLFDLIMGLNRWVYRVLAYVLLMTDDYPPFRLDRGGTDPGTGTPRLVVPSPAHARLQTAAHERRSGIWLTAIGSALVAAAFAMWWLVVNTNREGDPGDPQLLPIIAAIPLLIGIYRIVHARWRERHHL